MIVRERFRDAASASGDKGFFIGLAFRLGGLTVLTEQGNHAVDSVVDAIVPTLAFGFFGADPRRRFGDLGDRNGFRFGA